MDSAAQSSSAAALSRLAAVEICCSSSRPLPCAVEPMPAAGRADMTPHVLFVCTMAMVSFPDSKSIIALYREAAGLASA